MANYLTLIFVLTAIAGTVYMLKCGVNIGIVMLIASVFVAVLARIPFKTALTYGWQGLISDKTIKLILLLFLIMMLENIMRTTGMIKTMVESLKELVGSNRLAAAFMPTVIGLLPSPGGARFSCPMVEEVTGNSTEPENKAFVNYWFRHIWLDGFILYPGAIVASELLGVSVIKFFLALIPFMVLSVILGSIFGLSKIEKADISKAKSKVQSAKIFIKSMLPVIIAILTYIVLLKYTDYSLEIASSAVVAALFLIKKYKLKQILGTMREAFPIKLVIIIIGVMVFKEVLFGTGVLEGLPGLMKAYGIPVGAVYLLLPFLGGFSSGITVSYVSMTFPVLMTLGLGSNIWVAASAFVAGFAGTMATPLHLCGSMTADYFKCDLGKLLLRITLAAAVLFAAASAVVYFNV